jgi:hypothetical protein
VFIKTKIFRLLSWPSRSSSSTQSLFQCASLRPAGIQRERSPVDFFDLNSAYIAGFLDADGSIFAQIIERSDYKNLFQIRPIVSLFQKTARKHFLVQISQDLGFGTLRDRNDGISELTFSGWSEVQRILDRIFPYLRVKKKQAILLIRILEILPSTKESPSRFLEACLVVDKLAELNDSKNRKWTSQIVRERFLSLKIIDE